MPSQESRPHIDPGARKLMRSPDYIFAVRASQGALAEVRLGQLATERANDPEVKAFGQRMTQEHTKAVDQLKAMAERSAMTLPDELGIEEQAELNKLESLSGSDFDKEYVSYMVKRHSDDIKEFQKETKNGKIDEIRAFAEQTLPMLEAHLERIKTIQSSFK
jgi:putative membrane protein